MTINRLSKLYTNRQGLVVGGDMEAAGTPDATAAAAAGLGEKQQQQQYHTDDAVIMMTMTTSRAAAAASCDEELKEGSGDDDQCLHDIPLATSPTAAGSLDGSGGASTASAAPSRRPLQLQYRGITMASAAAKGDLANVVLLWGMAAAEGVSAMLPDEDVSFN
jgi:hypothetical protein